MMAKVGAAKPNARTGCGGLQRKANLVAGMKTDPDTGNGATDSAL
jgi:hypothetical protein